MILKAIFNASVKQHISSKKRKMKKIKIEYNKTKNCIFIN